MAEKKTNLISDNFNVSAILISKKSNSFLITIYFTNAVTLIDFYSKVLSNCICNYVKGFYPPEQYNYPYLKKIKHSIKYFNQEDLLNGNILFSDVDFCIKADISYNNIMDFIIKILDYCNNNSLYFTASDSMNNFTLAILKNIIYYEETNSIYIDFDHKYILKKA